MSKREAWATRIGLILAMAGNAIGLGNFLRFPVKATQNGGGAFMIPYFVAFLLLGVPLMWAEWAMGRYGGVRGHGTTPFMFHGFWRTYARRRAEGVSTDPTVRGAFERFLQRPLIMYIGVLGVFLPLGITVYYVYIESWTLAYAYFSGVQTYWGITDQATMMTFLQSFQGLKSSQHFDNLWWAYGFFVATMALNFYILYRGVAAGIELLAKVAMPALFVFAIVIAIRVATLGGIDAPPPHPVEGGFAFIWNPDFSKLGDANVWLAAAGQIFFTLSVACGAIQCYASYLRERDDIVVTGLSTSMTNEFAEVILGGSIAIPVAFAFFGAAGTKEIADGGTFNLGFAAMPIIFQKIPAGAFFGTLWFGLLFFAAVTSSVALMTPAITFLQDELGWSRKKSATVVSLGVFGVAHLFIFGLGHGTLDEMDFWCGEFGLAFFAFVESVLFFWAFGMDNAWKEMHAGAQRQIPRFFWPIMKYVTPIACFGLLAAWFAQSGLKTLTLAGVPDKDKPWIWLTRAVIIAGIALFCVLLKRASRKWVDKEEVAK